MLLALGVQSPGESVHGDSHLEVVSMWVVVTVSV